MTGPRDPLPTRVEDLPPLPDESRDLLFAGLAGLGLTLDGRACGALEGHLRLLLAWNRAINLTAIRDPLAAVREHLVDSLTAAPLLAARHVDDIVDLGSGGGFPGLPLAIARPATTALLVDSVAKKARFLETAVHALDLVARVGVTSVRAEALAAESRHRERHGAVVARGVARLAELAEIGLPLVRPGGILVAWKRRPLDEELAEAGGALRALGGGRAEVFPVAVPGLEDHVLVVVGKERRTPDSFPRDPARRTRRPL